jgi:hypothetical protein
MTELMQLLQFLQTYGGKSARQEDIVKLAEIVQKQDQQIQQIIQKHNGLVHTAAVYDILTFLGLVALCLACGVLGWLYWCQQKRIKALESRPVGYAEPALTPGTI